MFDDILLVVSGGIILVLYFLIFVGYFVNSKKKFERYSGFDAAKDVTTNYNDINIVSSLSVSFSEYDIKRNVIRLNAKNYEGVSYSDIFISSLLAGYSLVNRDNSNYFKFSFIFKRLRWISIIPFMMVFISGCVESVGDAKIGIMLMVLMLIYLYMRYIIVVSSNEIIRCNLRKDVYSGIRLSLERYAVWNKVSFVVGLILLLRLILIVIGG